MKKAAVCGRRKSVFCYAFICQFVSHFNNKYKNIYELAQTGNRTLQLNNIGSR